MNAPAKPAMMTMASTNRNQTPSPRSSTSQESTHDALARVVRSGDAGPAKAMRFVVARMFQVEDPGVVRALRAVDLVLDQTYSESLTLRKLGDLTSNRQYHYFNTVARHRDISRCPVAVLALYAVQRWGGGRPAATIRFDNYMDVPLLGDDVCDVAAGDAVGDAVGDAPPPSLSSQDSPELFSPERTSGPSSTSVWGRNKMARMLEPPAALLYVVFPWLLTLKDDLEHRDRTNYNLHSVCELFEFLAKVAIQDFAWLVCSNDLPRWQAVMVDCVPKLASNGSFLQYQAKLQPQVPGPAASQPPGRSSQPQWREEILSRVEDSYIEISRRFALHNQSVSHEIQGLKSELGQLRQLISDLVQSQKQLLNKHRSQSFGSMGNGSLAMDRNTFASNAINGIVGASEEQSPAATSLAPLNMLHSLSTSGMPDSQKRKLPLPATSGFSPQPADSPFKRFKFDEARLSQPPINPTATLDSLLSKPMGNQGLSIPSLSGLGASAQISSNYSTPGNTTQLAYRNPDHLEPHEPSGATSDGDAANEAFKYKLSRDNKTVWDLYNEWYVGLGGNPSIKSLIEMYGWRRWKVNDDSHFFPTRRIIIDYIERECQRGLRHGRFVNTDREAIRKVVTEDLEKFRVANGLSLNSLSMYIRNLTRRNAEICIYSNFQDWAITLLSEDIKNKFCRRHHHRHRPEMN
ncbi:LAMI_0E07184g1_1 [Lachancea mirantina]|uniref:LAMI_0E07184g1_1 n=1 Tax=Lachancea mirantina TaxID=1230905 RepID=A0A1G4JMH6_9SACH|nr:LAMI_0E07184g1_1 [Lachancea mirantina]